MSQDVGGATRFDECCALVPLSSIRSIEPERAPGLMLPVVQHTDIGAAVGCRADKLVPPPLGKEMLCKLFALEATSPGRSRPRAAAIAASSGGRPAALAPNIWILAHWAASKPNTWIPGAEAEKSRRSAWLAFNTKAV